MSKQKPFLYVLLGMLCGGLIGFFALYSLDNTKGWNPYGWWFFGTFVIAILGGFCGLFIFSSINKSSRIEKKVG